MKTLILFLLIFLSIPIFVASQSPKMSKISKQDVQFIKENIPFILKKSKTLWDNLPVTDINQEIYVSFLGKLKEDVTEIEQVENVIIGKGIGRIRSVRIKLTNLDKINVLNQFEYLELASKIRPSLERVNYDTRADSVHRGLYLPQSYTGKNILIGVNDWGFDYTSPMFYDTLLQNSRILAVWDQWKRSGPRPNNFNYGTEYNTWAEISTAQSDTSNQYGYGTHATHVAGIAGGSGAGAISTGVAFESEFLFTTILVDEAAAIDSWYWMYEKSLEYNKNLIVNMSWGLYNIGTSDGTSLLSQAIDELSDFGVLFVSSAGNNGGVNFHIKKEFNNDTIKTIVNFENYAQVDSLWGQSIHGWGEAGKDFEFKFEVLTPTGTVLDETPYFSTSMNQNTEGFIYIDNYDTIFYKVAAQSEHPQNLKPTIRLRIKNTNSNLTILLRATAMSGTVHCWNVAELTTNGGNWGLPFTGKDLSYTLGNREYGIGEPTAANSCLSVGSHVPNWKLTNGSEVGGIRSGFSSIGPRIDGVIKPDISAPGQEILSSISSFTDQNISLFPTTDFNGRTYGFAKLSGTSMASPAAAGVCALVWESNPYLTPLQIKDIITASARQDNFTGSIPQGGNAQWGHGKIDAIRAIQTALGILGLNEFESTSEDWQVFPNPTNDFLSIKGLENIQKVELYDMNGHSIALDNEKSKWDIRNYAKGSYIFRVIANQKVYQKKIIIQ